MTDDAETLRKLTTDLRIGFSVCTRLPVGPSAALGDGDVARASWTFSLAGLLVGLVGALVYWIAIHLDLSSQPAAALALAATMLLTGAIHEDGLADTADALGGRTPEQRLAIMRDSRIGSFGACALGLSLLVRWSAVADIADPPLVALALVAAHVAARACLPAFMHLVPPARPDGLSSGVGSPPGASVVAAALLGILALCISLGLTGAVTSLALLALAGLSLARLASRRFGGQTGDVLGAMEQVAESIVLLVGSALF